MACFNNMIPKLRKILSSFLYTELHFYMLAILAWVIDILSPFVHEHFLQFPKIEIRVHMYIGIIFCYVSMWQIYATLIWLHLINTIINFSMIHVRLLVF